MNVIFTAVFLSSLIAITICSPQDFLPALLGGGKSALELSFTMFTVYAVWMGLSKLSERSGLSENLSKFLAPAAKKVFKTQNKPALNYLAMNLSCNLLGLGGAATPYAVKAVGELEKDGNTFAQKLLFVINATSVQILPTTVIALRAGAGSADAADIFLPSLVCTAVSTLTAVALFIAGSRIWR